MKRRDFLKLGAKVGVAANVLPVMMGGFPIRALGRSPLRNALSTASTNNNVLVIIQLAGGNDGLNCLIPYGDPLYKSNRPTLGLDKTADNLLVIPDHTSLAFHGQMQGALDLYNAGKLAVLQNVGYLNPILSHFRGTDIWNTATDSNISMSSGWVGRMLYGLNPTYPPATIPAGSQPLAIQFGTSLSNLFLSRNGGMGIAINRLPTSQNPSVHNYDAVSANPTVPEQELEYVRIIQSETEIYAQTIAKRSVTANKITYPANNTLATQLESVAQLIASGFTTKVYLVTLGGFDTHSNQLTGQANLLGQLAAAMKAFQDDLEAFGVADQVATMTYSEFGRRVKENGSGTDHGTAAPHFVFGTQVIGGMRGKDPQLDDAHLISGNLTYDPLYEYRNVYATAMSEWLGIDDASIGEVLTASNGQTFSKISSWSKLGIFKTQSSSVGDNASSDAPGLMLMENYPNPVTNRTTIEYALPESMPVELGIFNTGGVEVARLVDQRQSAGIYKADFTPGNLPSGYYIYRLTTPKGEISKQMIVVK
ncbi:MAG: DUF1501 domain-containing protein [Bacteroidota bacterium]|nr:DUF1501 domain-containing protein [Bacteroidota bacterium]